MTTMRSTALAAGLLVLSMGTAMAEQITVTGTVTDTFGHRYVVDDGAKKSLIDIGPKGRDAIAIKTGDKLTVEGEMVDSGEIRAARVAVGSQAAVDLPEARSWWQKLTGAGKDDGTPFGPVEAKAEVTKAGYEIIGEPKPEKKHFEILGKKDGKFYELHAHKGGDVKNIRTVDATDPKWGPMVK